jgi:hypothetical protein
VAVGEDDDEFVAAVQFHAREAHGMNLSVELVLYLADAENATIVAGSADGRTVPRVVAEETAVSPGRERIR